MFRPGENTQTFSWHKNCFSNYVSEEKIRRRELALLSHSNANGKPNNDSDVNTSNFRKKSDRKNPPLNDYCIICSHISRKKDRTLFILSECSAAEKLLYAARIKQDDVFTRICMYEKSENLLAQRFRYHKSCFLGYTYLKRDSNLKRGRPCQNIPRDILLESFDKLLEETDDFENKAYELTYLTNRIVELSGLEDVTLENRTTKELLIEKYGQKVLFSHPFDRSKSSMVMVTSIPIEKMAEKIRESDCVERKLKSVAEILKQEIEENKFLCKDFVKDETVLDRSLNSFELPPMWSLFFKNLIGRLKGLCTKKMRRAKSIYMDLYQVVTSGNTPKHVALAQSVHHLTRSKHLVTILFKLGHCVSYNQLLEFDSELYRKLLWENQSVDVPIPANILKDTSLFLHAAIDNNDFLEETLSGKNTTHVTAMVLYQEKSESKSNDIHMIQTATLRELNLCHSVPLPCQTVKRLEIPNKPPLSSACADMSSLVRYTENRTTEMVRIILKTSVDSDNRLKVIDDSAVPGWSPFQQLLSTSTIPITTIGYCTMIPEAPTSRDVVYTAIMNFVSLFTSCGKQFGVLTADMSIYLIAKRIQMQSREFSNVILRIGTFHLQKNWLRCLGQYLEGSGMESIITEEAEIYGECTLQSIMNGQHYNRGVRMHKLLYEAIIHIQLAEFISVADPNIIEYISSSPQLDKLRKAMNDRDGETFCSLYECVYSELEAVEFFQKFNDFVDNKVANDETIMYYMKYCEMVEIMLDSIKADREGNFELHLSSARKMLPYFFAMNHPNYARGVTLYLQDMLNLPPEVENDLRRGMLSVKRSKDPFNGVGCDLALEQSQIRSSAVPGGLIGITQKKQAMEKWVLLHPTKNAIHNVLTEFCDMNSDPTSDVSFSHSEWAQSKVKRDDTDVRKLTNILQEKHIFSTKVKALPLHNVTTGKVIDDCIATHVLKVKERGEDMLYEFMEKCFKKREKSVFDCMSRVSFKTLNYSFKPANENSVRKAVTELEKTKRIINIQNTILLASQREYNLRLLASYEMLEQPKALVDNDGLMKKPQKYTLVDAIEMETNCEGNMSDILNLLPSVPVRHIFDGMAVVYIVQLAKFSTFGEFAGAFFKYISSFFSPTNAKRIDLVFDRYDEPSIKYSETSRRNKDCMPTQIKIISLSTKIPKNIRNFLGLQRNKQELVDFLCQYARTNMQLSINQTLVISGGFEDRKKCFKISYDSFEEVTELTSNHIEADTRMFVHAFSVAPGSEIILHSSDTDVFILGVHLWTKLKQLQCRGLWFEIKSKRSRVLGCHIVAEEIGDEIASVLPALHAFTGCDTTSKISSKPRALQLVKSNEVQASLKPLGNGKILTPDQIIALEKTYLKLINRQETSADEARYVSISRSLGNIIELEKIPCTSDALHQHALRASAQTYIWINTTSPIFEPIQFTNFGFKSEGDRIIPRYLTKEIVPVDLIAPCKCSKTCKTMWCSCKKQGVSCIQLCRCLSEDCTNI